MAGKKGTVFVNKPRKKKQVKKLEKLTDKTTDSIYSIESVFPFDLVPNQVTATRSKVDIVYKDIIGRREFPILIEDIKTVKVDTGLLFGTLRFEISGFEKNPPPVKYLRLSEARKMRKIISGLITVQKEDLKLSSVPNDKLIDELLKIGAAY